MDEQEHGWWKQWLEAMYEQQKAQSASLEAMRRDVSKINSTVQIIGTIVILAVLASACLTLVGMLGLV